MKKINACAHAVALVLTLANTTSITCAEEVPNSTPEVNLNDSKITASEKKLDQIQTQAANTFVKQQAEVLNTVPGVDSNLTKVSGQMGSVQSSLSGTYSVLRKMGPDLKNVRLDIGKIRDPIAKMQRPLEAIASPIQNLDREVTLVGREMKQLRVPLTLMEKPVTSLDKQLTGLHSEISELRSLLALVLTSIFVAAGLSAVGTPIAAILVWRNKNKFLPKLKPGESSEDNLVGAGATAGSRRL